MGAGVVDEMEMFEILKRQEQRNAGRDLTPQAPNILPLSQANSGNFKVLHFLRNWSSALRWLRINCRCSWKIQMVT
jgi:hypothetical protein